MKKDKRFDAILLLGLRLIDGEKPEKELIDRVQVAAGLFKSGACDRVIACGGAVEPGEKTEAEVMQALLKDMGVGESAIIREDASRITYENIQNAKKILNKKHPRVLLVTSDYHMRRARLLCLIHGIRAKDVSSQTPEGPEKKAKRRLELFYTVDMILGYQNPKRARPEWLKKLSERLTEKPKSAITHRK